jgi:hypothetical protein
MQKELGGSGVPVWEFFSMRVPPHLVIESVRLLDIWTDVRAIYLKEIPRQFIWHQRN